MTLHDFLNTPLGCLTMLLAFALPNIILGILNYHETKN